MNTSDPPSAAHSSSPWTLVNGRSLTELLQVTEARTAGGCQWRRGSCDLDDDLDAAAWLIASEVMRLRCGPATDIYATWESTARGIQLANGQDPSIVTPFAEPTFGLPTQPGTANQVEGYVAEIAWIILTKEAETAQRPIRYLPAPDADVSGPGADGFVIYALPAEDGLEFRLWEIKKTSGNGTPAATIRNAYEQLKEKGGRYLAKVTGESQVPSTDPELILFLSLLVPRWRQGHESAGAGVAVATNVGMLPATAFTTMHTHFPALSNPSRLEGCLLGFGGYSEFAEYVRYLVWSGLSHSTS